MKKLKLKTGTQLRELLKKIQTGDHESLKEFYDYFDLLHSKILDYQLIIDNIHHSVKDDIKIVTL